MPEPTCEPDPAAVPSSRSQALRRHATETLQRAAALRERSQTLLARGGLRPPKEDVDALDEAELRQWYRVQVRQMQAAGWTRAELADVGITDGLLRELGLAE